MKPFLHRLARWLARKTAPLLSPPAATWQPIDAYRRLRPPTAADSLAELKNTAWACASINAGVCAASPPKLYVQTMPGQPAPRCRTRALDPHTVRTRSVRSTWPSAMVEEVLDHPLLTLLRQVNPWHNAFDLWELTQHIFGEEMVQ